MEVRQLLMQLLEGLCEIDVIIAGFHGCVIAHVDNNAKLVPNKGGDARFQAIVDDTQHVKWAELMPEGFQAVQGTLYLTGNSDPGLANAIAAGFHNVIQGGAAVVNQSAEGYGVQLDAGGAPQYPPTWFVGNPDTWYKFVPHTVQGTLAWTNDF